MKFLCLGYYNEKKFAAMPKVEVDALVRSAARTTKGCAQRPPAAGGFARRHARHDERAAEERRAVRHRRTVRRNEGADRRLFIIEAADLAEAARIASLHPAAHLGEEVGWGIEVRPIDYFLQP